MKFRYYLVIKNNVTNELSVVGTFTSLGDAARCSSLLNKDLEQAGDTTKKYGVTDDPLFWRP